MGAEKRRRFQPDPRTWLLLCLLGLAAILVTRDPLRNRMPVPVPGVLAHPLTGGQWRQNPYLWAVLPHFLRYWLVGRADDGQRDCLFGQLHAVQHRYRQPKGTGATFLYHLSGGRAHRIPDGGAEKTASAKGCGDRDGGRAAILSDNRQ